VLCPCARAQLASPTAVAPSLGFAEDRFIVRLTPEASRAAFVAPQRGRIARARLGLPSLDRVLASWPGAWLEPEFRGDRPPAPGSNETDFSAFYVVHLPAGANRDAAITQFRAAGVVTEAHPIAFTSVTAVPNDSLFSIAYHLYQPSRRDIHAPEAWDITKGDTSIVVAIIDTGVVPYHPDLGGTVAGGSGQFWTNPIEAAGVPGEDDDHNGFVDDLHGWDFVDLITGFDAVPGEDWRDEDNDPNDFIGHGTCVAGLIGAINDNTIGVTGTAWNVRLMPLRVVYSSVRQQTGIVDMSYVTEAIRYATLKKADVINISLSNVSVSELDLAVDAAVDSGIVVVVAAGNNGTPNYIGDGHPEVVVVAATDADDVIPVWSNHNSHVDLAAPGVNLPTTVRLQAGTDSLSLRAPGYVPDVAGTSFSTPLVSGAVALIQSARRARGLGRLDSKQAGTVLRYTADDIAAQNPGITGFGGGRLQMARAVAAASRVRFQRLTERLLAPGVSYRTNRGDSLLAYVAEDGRFGARLVLYNAIGLGVMGSVPLPSIPTNALAAADLGAGRGLGIFVPLGDRIAGFGAAGAELPGWPVRPSRGGLIGSPVLGDLDGDGSLEIVSKGTEGAIWAWTSAGALLPGFPIFLGGGAEIYAPLALSDVDAQPGAEIIVAETNGTVHAFTWTGATEAPGWPVATGDPVPAGPVVAELAGQPVVVVSGLNAVHRIASNGSQLPSTARIGSEVSRDPALGDLDHDGTDEIVVTAPSGAQATALSGAGGTEWQVPWNNPVVGAPLIGWFTASDSQGVAVPVGTRLQGIAGSGATLPDFLPYPEGNPILALVTTGVDDSVRLIQGTSSDSTLYSYEFHSGAAGGRPSWPTQRGNFARTASRLYRPAMSEGDAIPPVRISDLGARAPDSTSNLLRWTAPLDVGPTGKALEYDLRAGFTSNLLLTNFPAGKKLPIALVPAAAGEAESLLVSGLATVDRYFAIRSRDASGNWSPASAPIQRLYPAGSPPPPPGGPTTLALAVGANPARLPVPISWQAPGGGGHEVRIYDLGGRLLRSIALGSASQGAASWDGRATDGANVPSGVYLMTLIDGPRRTTIRFVLLQ